MNLYLALGAMYVLTVMTGRDHPAILKEWADKHGHSHGYVALSVVATAPLAALLWPLFLSIRIGKRIKETA